jgi:predicted ATPase
MSSFRLSIPRITAITVSGFKSIASARKIQIRPLTILAGANSSGKSSIMQPLLLLKQTLEASYDPGALLLDGPNVKFTSLEQFLVKKYRQSYDDFRVGISIGDDSIETVFRRNKQKRQIQVRETTYSNRDSQSSFSQNMSLEEIKQQLSQSDLERLHPHPDRQQERLSTLKVRNDRCFLRLNNPFLDANRRTFRILQEGIANFLHLPGLRRSPERIYTAARAHGELYPGTFENYVASVITDWQETKDKRLLILIDHLNYLKLTSTIEAKAFNDVQIELRVGKSTSSPDATISIADVGLGVSQVLPVLVALLTALPGQLVYIEQPELHLHPRAQYLLAKCFADAAERGVQIVVETHSDLFIEGVQTLVAEGKLSPDKVILHWFTRGEDETTTITSAELDENGAFGDWPEDFASTRLEAHSRYLDAAMSRLPEA